MVPGVGTLVNVVAILVGSALGVALGDRLPQRTRAVVTDGLGLVTLLVGALSAAAVLDPALRDDVGSGAPVLIVLASVVVGGVLGSLLHLERRLEDAGAWLRRRLSPSAGDAGTHRFVEGFVTASLLFCVGPLAILGALSDGLGTGIEQLVLKSVLDGFAALAFAAALGWGVAASAVAVAVYQGVWTLLGVLVGGVMSPAEIAALTAAGAPAGGREPAPMAPQGLPGGRPASGPGPGAAVHRRGRRLALTPGTTRARTARSGPSSFRSQ